MEREAVIYDERILAEKFEKSFKWEILNSDISGIFPKFASNGDQLVISHFYDYIERVYEHKNFRVIINNKYKPDRANKLLPLTDIMDIVIICDFIITLTRFESSKNGKDEDLPTPDLYKYKQSLILLKYYTSVYPIVINEQLLIIKIIRKCDDYYIAKLPIPKLVNADYNLFIPSTYVLLYTKTFRVYPIFMSHPYIEKDLINPMIHFSPTNLNLAPVDFWKPVPFEECSVCMEADGNCHAYCKTSHIVSCSVCIKKLTKCPICDDEIFSSYPLIDLSK